VNGARTVEGSAKREPFSESHKNGLDFRQRRSHSPGLSSVTPGQLLFLTNEKTKKEVVCQVVKSKNYRNVQRLRRTGIHRVPSSVSGACVSRVIASDLLRNLLRPLLLLSVYPLPAPSRLGPARSRQLSCLARKCCTQIFESRPAVPAVVARKRHPKLSESKLATLPASVIEIPAATKPAALDSNVPATPASLMPELPVNAVPIKPVGPVTSTFDLPRTPEAHASIFTTSAQPPRLRRS